MFKRFSWVAVFLLLFPTLSESAENSRIIVDTDSALFNDDGTALALLLQSPLHNAIAGVTLVAGNHWPLQGVEYMGHVLKVMNRPDIQLFLSEERPYRNSTEFAKRLENSGVKLGFIGAFGRPFPKTPANLNPPIGGAFSGLKANEKKAVQFLVDEINRHPGEVTVLAIGPLTNIAKAIESQPPLARKIKRIVIMGGNVSVPGNTTSKAELNFWFDAEAAQIILRSDIREKVLIPLDLTDQAKIDKSHFDQIVSKGTPLTELYKEALGNRSVGFLKPENANATTNIWDTLAAAYLIDPTFITERKSMYLDVITEFGENYGAVRVPVKPEKDQTPVTVLTRLDFDRFFELYKKLLTQPVGTNRSTGSDTDSLPHDKVLKDSSASPAH